MKKANPNDKKYWLKRKYGISLEEYNRMFDEQNGCCAICGIHQSKLNRRLGVDHNHETKQIRGLLCSNCNTLIGLSKENEDIFIYASLYLEKYKKRLDL